MHMPCNVLSDFCFAATVWSVTRMYGGFSLDARIGLGEILLKDLICCCLMWQLLAAVCLW